MEINDATLVDGAIQAIDVIGEANSMVLNDI